MHTGNVDASLSEVIETLLVVHRGVSQQSDEQILKEMVTIHSSRAKVIPDQGYDAVNRA